MATKITLSFDLNEIRAIVNEKQPDLLRVEMKNERNELAEVPVIKFNFIWEK